ncbi:MAG TPA: acyl carrier protein [Gammaproteobacteria bacterium]
MTDRIPPGIDSAATSLTGFVCDALAQACSRDRRDVSPDTRMLELDVDSLTLVSVLAQVEAVYGIELTPEDTLAMMEAAAVSDLADRLAVVIMRAHQGREASHGSAC